jgi:hypothetical protein
MDNSQDLRIPAPADFKPVAEPWFDQGKDVVKVCHGFTCGRRGGSKLLKLLKGHFTGKDVQVVACPCTGNCRKSSNVVVNRNILHMQQPERVADNVERELAKQKKEVRQEKQGGMSVDEADSILGL